MIAGGVLGGMSLWIRGMMCTPCVTTNAISSSSSSSTSSSNSSNMEMLKRDRSHRSKMSHFCGEFVMETWFKLNERLDAQQQQQQQQQQQATADIEQEVLRRLLDDIKVIVHVQSSCTNTVTHTQI